MNHKYHKNSELEMMMLNIILESQLEVWQTIEEEKDAWKRIEKRKLYTKALNELGKEDI